MFNLHLPVGLNSRVETGFLASGSTYLADLPEIPFGGYLLLSSPVTVAGAAVD